MSNVAKLKKKAAEFEQKRQFDKALAVYVQVLQASRGTAEEADVALFNRVGDLYMRQGNTNEALTYYERAVDLYADGGYFNNAIALCNKILRQSPGRTVIYYKLGKISAQKGFKSDAKASFLEYAGRMQKVGQLDEAFRALREFADLSPDQEDVRMLLADQLGKNGRKDQALEQLQQLYEKFSAEGRGDEARATQARMQALDANAQPRASATPLRSQAQDLVFLDLDSDGDGDEVPAVSPPGAAAAPGRATPLASTAPKGVDSLPFLNLDEDEEEEEETPAAASAPAAPAPAAPSLDAPSLELPSVEPPRESARTDDRAAVTDAAPPAVEGFERTSLGGPPPPPALAVPDFGVSDFAPPTLSLDDFAQHVEDAAAADDRPLPIPAHDLVLPGELPSVDSLGAPTSAVDGLDMYLPSGFDLDPMAGVQGASGALGIDTDGTLQPTPYQGFEAIPFDLSTAAPASSPAEDVPLPTIELDAFAGTPSAEPEATDDPPAFDPLGGWSDGPLVQPAGATAAESAEDDSVFDLSAFDDPEIDEPLAAPVGDASRGHAAGVAAPAVSVVDALRGRVETAPGDWELRRRLAEAMFEAGDREGGLRELEAAMAGYERDGDLDGAGGVVDEIVRVQPNSVRHHQKRVEYAVRGGDRPRLADAYVQLADALFRSGQTEMAKAVYQRVLDLVPDDARARAALSAFVDAPSRPAVTAAPAPRPAAAAPPAPAAPPRSDPAPAPRPAPRPVPPRVAPLATPPVAPPRAAGAPPPAAAPRPANPAPALGDGEFVDLGEWLRADEPVKSTRMRIDEQAPTGDEQADFNEMLKKFKAGVAENVDADDHESHYDLGVAFKEMGLLDDAIAEFQKALRAPGRRARTYEALGQCFMEKQQLPVALTILQRALGEPGVGDDQLVGVLYLLGYASEALQRRDDAVAYYQRVFAVDIQFRDVGDRLNALEKVAR